VNNAQRQQNCHMGRNPNNNKKKRKNKINPREFIIDLENIEKIGKTTLMIKNIPNRYNKNMLVRTLNKNHAGKFDFFYLPIDFKVLSHPAHYLCFKNQCNVGYAFINFTSTSYIKPFYIEFNN
jgi:hypothetical protein